MKMSVNIRNRNVPPSDMLADVRRVSEKIGKDTVSQSEYNDHGKYNSTTLTRKIGSWFKVLEMAGLKPSRSPLGITVNQLMENITDVWYKLGRQPNYSEVKAPLSKFSAGTYENRFGSWTNALVEFKEYIEKDDEIEKATEKLVTTQDRPTLKHKTKREVSDRMRFRVLMRDGFTCKTCGSSPVKSMNVELHVDHIKPWSLGGETTLDNLESKCQICNLGKSNMDEVKPNGLTSQ